MVFFSPKPSDPCYPWESKSSVAPPRRTEEVPFGGGNISSYMLNFMSFAKKHFKIIVFFLYGFVCIFLWICFSKRRTSKIHTTPPRISSSNGLFPGERGFGSSNCNSLATVADATSGGPVGSTRMRVDPWGMRMLAPQKKNLGKVATPMFLNMVHPENYLGKMITHFDPFWWILIFRRGVGEKPPTGNLLLATFCWNQEIAGALRFLGIFPSHRWSFKVGRIKRPYFLWEQGGMAVGPA